MGSNTLRVLWSGFCASRLRRQGAASNLDLSLAANTERAQPLDIHLELYVTIKG